jgi:multidrug efflux pump subunit AcrA (membrane-fusion protein)
MRDLSNLNLGQLVGRALYGVLERRPQPALVDAAEAARREAEQRQAVERERAARDEAARREQERSLDRARAAKIREEAQAARAAAEERRAQRAAGVAARKRKATKAPPAPHRIGTSSAIRALLARHPEGLRSGEIAATLGIKVGLASAHLCTLSGVVRSGERGRFVFRLKQG